LEVVRGGGDAYVAFDSSGGRLEADGTGALSVSVAGFASPIGVFEAIDFASVGFIPGVTKVSFTEAGTNTSGTLSVTNGTQTANLTLLGFYSTGNFQITNDGFGGTLVTDPPLVGSASNPTLASQSYS